MITRGNRFAHQLNHGLRARLDLAAIQQESGGVEPARLEVAFLAMQAEELGGAPESAARSKSIADPLRVLVVQDEVVQLLPDGVEGIEHLDQGAGAVGKAAQAG